MTTPAGIIVPKNRLVGAARRKDFSLDTPRTLSGASGEVHLAGEMGMASLPVRIDHLEYWFAGGGLSGTPHLIVGIRPVGTSLDEIIVDELSSLRVTLADETFDVGNDTQLNSVDLSSFTNEQRTLVEGEELVAFLKGTNGDWINNELKVNALGLEEASDTV